MANTFFNTNDARFPMRSTSEERTRNLKSPCSSLVRISSVLAMRRGCVTSALMSTGRNPIFFSNRDDVVFQILPSFKSNNSFIYGDTIFVMSNFESSIFPIPSRVKTARRTNVQVGGNTKGLSSFIERNSSPRSFLLSRLIRFCSSIDKSFSHPSSEVRVAWKRSMKSRPTRSMAIRSISGPTRRIPRLSNASQQSFTSAS
mmetsp:Transcript_24953/g.35568  ORF Transcript_24953/g.35568 Transcript_24953/m.35568 type:complete len:201 (+) Transcript_24953:414-1016(+)